MLERGKSTFGHGGGSGCHANCQLGQTAAIVKVGLVSETVLLLIVDNISNSVTDRHHAQENGDVCLCSSEYCNTN